MSKLGEELVTDGDLNIVVGMLRGEPVDMDEDRGSMAVLNAVGPVGESTREPMVAVSTEKRGQGGERRLTHRRAKEEEKEWESQGRIESRKSKPCVACGARPFPQILSSLLVGAPKHRDTSQGMQCATPRRL